MACLYSVTSDWAFASADTSLPIVDLEDLRYAPLIEDEDLLVGLDKLRREVGLYVAEADDQVRIQVTDLFDVPVNERGDDWMVILASGGRTV